MGATGLETVRGATGEPTMITSKTMIAKNKEGKAIFEGDVVLRQGDLTVRSDTMIIFFKQHPARGQSEQAADSMSDQRIELIEASGRVIIEKGEGKATCRHALYYKDQEKVVLTGSPVAWQKGTRVSGPRMTMYLRENRSVVEGGSRVVIMDEGNSTP